MLLQEDLSDHLASFVLKIEVLKKLKTATQTDTQLVLYKNYIKVHVLFLFDHMDILSVCLLNTVEMFFCPRWCHGVIHCGTSGQGDVCLIVAIVQLTCLRRQTPPLMFSDPADHQSSSFFQLRAHWKWIS